MADQLNRPCSETTAALLQSRGNSIFPKKKTNKKKGMVVAREQDFWLKHKQLVNTNLAEIHCIEQSSAFLPVGSYFPQRQVSELISLIFSLSLSLYWQCIQAWVQHINLLFVNCPQLTLWAALCRANSFSQQLCAEIFLQKINYSCLKHSCQKMPAPLVEQAVPKISSRRSSNKDLSNVGEDKWEKKINLNIPVLRFNFCRDSEG